MTNLASALQQLRAERKEVQGQMEKLEKAIAAIEGLVSGPVALNGVRSGRAISAASRKRMARAQRERWAKLRKESQASTNSGKKAALSLASRRKIAAAQRARWARVKAQQAKKAA